MFASGAIDLGAPVLSFESTVSLEASTSSSSSYTPVTISSPTYSQSNSNSPNSIEERLEIIVENQVFYKNETYKVELEPETVIQTETIIVDSPLAKPMPQTPKGEA
jgi:hypothetical protein